MKILHQAGHYTNWNIESLKKDLVGYGIIFSPVHYGLDQIERLPKDIRKKSLFDPQFYIPNSPKKKLNSYSFFPEKAIAGGFKTDKYNQKSVDIAKKCIEFQEKQEFESIIIPTRYIESGEADYIMDLTQFSVTPFLQAKNQLKTKKKLVLTLALSDWMLLSQNFRDDLIAWVLSLKEEIQSIYLMVSFDEISKQIANYEKLAAYFNLISVFKRNGLGVICGYNNTEGLLYTLLNVDAITIGAFENTRRFSVDKFFTPEEERRGPAPRLYIPKLLNWVRVSTLAEIRSDHPDLWAKVYSGTTYGDAIMNHQKPSFNKPDIYKHHFCLINDQYKTILGFSSIQDRANKLREMIGTAITLYGEIEKKRIKFTDLNCSGEHLAIWNRLVNKISPA